MLMNREEVVKEQYHSGKNLGTRISIHEKYSVNKQSFGDWIVENYEIQNGMRVLELGCGNGNIWKNHMDLFARCGEVFLTDLSEGMLAAARENLGKPEHVTYKIVDIQEIPFEDASFDMVIANMMLYHVPDLRKGLTEVRRVLKPGEKFYCATGSEINVLQFVADKLAPYGVDYRIENPFTLENGMPKLEPQFSDIQLLRREDALDVTDLEDLLDYIFSSMYFAKACTLDRAAMKEILKKEMVNGVLHIPKVYGMFIAKA